MRVICCVTLIAVMMFCSGSIQAEVPQSVNYQGHLTDDTGAPVPDDYYELTFTIYTGLPPLAAWSSGVQSVLVVGGLFNYQLGGNVALPYDLFASDTICSLGIKVGDDPEIVPHTPLTSVPYAYKALRADTADYAKSGWIDDGNTVRLEDGSDKVGIGTSSPTHRLHITGSEADPLVFIEKTGSGRGLKVRTVSACAIWVEYAGNHGLRVTHANGNGVYVASAGGWAGYFNGTGYFADDVGIGTTSPAARLHVSGGSIRTDGQLLSTVATGTPPIEVLSETMAPKLNADMVDGQHASAFSKVSAGTIDMELLNGYVTIDLPADKFDKIPELSVTVIVTSGDRAGQLAKVISRQGTLTSMKLKIAAADGSSLNEHTSLQISYVAVQ